MLDTQTRAHLIHDRAFALVLDARRWPHTKQAAHRYVCLGIKWALTHNLPNLAGKLSAFSLQLGEIHG